MASEDLLYLSYDQYANLVNKARVVQERVEKAYKHGWDDGAKAQANTGHDVEEAYKSGFSDGCLFYVKSKESQ